MNFEEHKNLCGWLRESILTSGNFSAHHGSALTRANHRTSSELTNEGVPTFQDRKLTPEISFESDPAGGDNITCEGLTAPPA